MDPLEIFLLPAFEDNYIWCLRRANAVAVVDPGDATPVLEHLANTGNQLCAILITHHHRDHTGGIAQLRRHFPVPTYAPEAESIPETTHPVRGNDVIHLSELGVDFDVLDVAGHTRGHVAYYRPGTLFCGDTLFGCGCGRLFEGTAAQLHAALTRIAVLPRLTFIYCAHEYTASGLRFAQAVEPGNASIAARAIEVQRALAADQSTVPFTLEDELATSPFLRCHVPEVIASAAKHVGHDLSTDEEVFAALRTWRDRF